MKRTFLLLVILFVALSCEKEVLPTTDSYFTPDEPQYLGQTRYQTRYIRPYNGDTIECCDFRGTSTYGPSGVSTDYFRYIHINDTAALITYHEVLNLNGRFEHPTNTKNNKLYLDQQVNFQTEIRFDTRYLTLVNLAVFSAERDGETISFDRLDSHVSLYRKENVPPHLKPKK